MRRCGFALGTLIGTLSLASAADLPRRAAAPPILPVMTWTGFYVGGNIGYLQSDRDSTIGTPLFGSAAFAGGIDANVVNAQAATGRTASASGFLGGGQVGYNQQFGSIVIGIEADIQAGIRSDNDTRDIALPFPGFPANPVVGTKTSSEHYEYFGTVRGRAGYTVSDNLLVYGTGGFAYAEKESATNISLNVTPGAGSFVTLPYGTRLRTSATRTGYTVGGGLEYAFSANWTVKAEALYYDLGRSSAATTFNSFTAFTTPASLFTTTGFRQVSRDEGVIARLGVNYKFSTF